MDRRLFAGTLAGFISAARSVDRGRASPGFSDLDEFITEKMRRDHIPGVAAALVRGDRIAWSKSYGWADLGKRIPMSLDRLQNIASISKTFTTTALMQLGEAGRFQLDDDVSGYLPFPVRNPLHPEANITFRHLLTHRSSIRDGSAYSRRYTCGDPKMSLGTWLEGYFKTDGPDYSAKENFHEWAPGGGWDYCNVAYGLIGYLAERMSGAPLEAYCRAKIFTPLTMGETSWYLANIDVAKHVVPYTWVGDGTPRGPSWGGMAQGVVHEPNAPPGEPIDGFVANCLYNHPNFPDGFLRTSVRKISRYVAAYLGGGAAFGRRILKEETVRTLLAPQQVEKNRTQGLTWYATASIRHQLAWGHGGSDPGVNTDLRLLPGEKLGAIAFLNTNGARPDQITERILTVAPEL